MPVLPARHREDLKREFRKELKKDITIRLFTQKPSPLTIPGRECRQCPQTQELMEELASLSPKLHLEVYEFHDQTEETARDGVERIPAIVMGDEGASRIKHYGLPAGNEFAVIIADIKTLSRGVSPLSMATRKKLRSVNQRVHIQVFVTPASVDCPKVAALAHAIALENPLITADVIEVEEFPALAQMYAVRSVPKTVMGTASPLTGVLPQIQFVGVIRETEFVEMVLETGVRAGSQER